MEPSCKYDIKGFSNDLGIPVEDVADLYSEFIHEIYSELAELKKFLGQSDLNAIKEIIHNVKGVSANYRITDIYDETVKIYSTLKENSVPVNEATFQNFFVICESAINEIKKYFGQKGFSI